MPRFHVLTTDIARATEAEVTTILLRFLKVTIDASTVHTLGLNGAKLTQHERFSDFIEDIDVDHSEYVEFLRLFASVKFMHKYKRIPKDTCIADEIAKITPEVADTFRTLRFTDEMMREMEPTVFAPMIGMRAGALRLLQTAYIDLVEPRDGIPAEHYEQ
jgi:hypothetical protein